MLRVIKVVLVLMAVLFTVIGMRWLVDPGGSAQGLGFELARGLGRSSQIGDLFSFFLTISVCILTAIVTNKRFWLLPPLLLFAAAIVGRLVAWLVHDAAFAAAPLTIEGCGYPVGLNGRQLLLCWSQCWSQCWRLW